MYEDLSSSSLLTKAAPGPSRRSTNACIIFLCITMCGKKKLLMITTSVCACASFAFLCIAVATDYWLYMFERISNGTGDQYTYNSTYTGLWRKCHVPQNPDRRPTCTYINYFQAMERDGLGPTDAILLSMRRSTLFPLISLFILLVGEIVCFIGHCNHKKKVLTFIAGILYVVGGLVTLIGIILFIGAITEEVGSKSKASGMDEPKFRYHYGASFMMTVGSFIVSEMTGVLSVYLYISRHKDAYRKKQERMTMLDSTERPTSSSRYTRRSRDNSPSHSDTYYTYTPVSDTSKEMSNYTLTRDPSRHTLSTSTAIGASADHLCREHSLHSMGGGIGMNHTPGPHVGPHPVPHPGPHVGPHVGPHPALISRQQHAQQHVGAASVAAAYGSRDNLRASSLDHYAHSSCSSGRGDNDTYARRTTPV